MKVYVVYGVDEYDGCSEPIAAFSTSTEAGRYADVGAMNDGIWHDYYKVAELEIDAAPTQVGAA